MTEAVINIGYLIGLSKKRITKRSMHNEIKKLDVKILKSEFRKANSKLKGDEDTQVIKIDRILTKDEILQLCRRLGQYAIPQLHDKGGDLWGPVQRKVDKHYGGEFNIDYFKLFSSEEEYECLECKDKGSKMYGNRCGHCIHLDYPTQEEIVSGSWSDAESFSAEPTRVGRIRKAMKTRGHGKARGKKKGPYVFPSRKAYPIGTMSSAKTALIFSAWPKNKKDAAKVRKAVFKRYPQLRQWFKGLKYEKGSPEDYEAESFSANERYPNEEKYWWVKEFRKNDCPEHYDEDDGFEICPTCNGTDEVIQDNVAFCNFCKTYTIGVSLGGYYGDLPCDCHDKWGYDWDNGTVDWMEHEDFLTRFPAEESYNKMLQEHNANPPCCPNWCNDGGEPGFAYGGCTFEEKAESFSAESNSLKKSYQKALKILRDNDWEVHENNYTIDAEYSDDVSESHTWAIAYDDSDVKARDEAFNILKKGGWNVVWDDSMAGQGHIEWHFYSKNEKSYLAESFSAEESCECGTDKICVKCNSCEMCDDMVLLYCDNWDDCGFAGCTKCLGDNPEHCDKPMQSEYDAESFNAHPIRPTRPSDDYGENRPKRPIRRPNRRPFGAEIMGYNVDNKTIGVAAVVGLIGGWLIARR